MDRHFHRPDHRNGQDRIEPVAEDRHDGDRVGCCNEIVLRSTFPVLDGEIPLSLHRCALEYVEQKDRQRPHGDNHHANFERPNISFQDCDPEEKDGDAKFNEHHVGNIGSGSKRLILEELVRKASY